MMGTIAATLQNKVQKSLTNQKMLSVLMYALWSQTSQIKSIVFLDSNEKQNVKHKLHGHKTNTHTHTHSIWLVGRIKSDDEL